jgi:AcrR family transcriptional regulator
MPRGRREPLLSKAEIVAKVREVSMQFGDDLGIKQFTGQTGVPESQIYRHWKSFGDLKEAAGLPRRSAAPKLISDDEALGEFHRIVVTLGRLPTFTDLQLHGKISATFFYRRFGKKDQLVGRYRRWLGSRAEKDRLDRERAERELEQRRRNFTKETPDASKRKDVAWLRRTWQELRVGFEIRSSDFQEKTSADRHLADLIVVFEHDWPGCPVRVLEIGRVLLRGQVPPGPLPEPVPELAWNPARMPIRYDRDDEGE